VPETAVEKMSAHKMAITGWWFQPSGKNISQWERLSQILWKIKNVPNHRPDGDNHDHQIWYPIFTHRDPMVDVGSSSTSPAQVCASKSDHHT